MLALVPDAEMEGIEMRRLIETGKVCGKVLSIALVFSMVLSGVVLTSMLARSSETKQELILRVAMQDDVKTLNPLVAGDVWTWNVLGWLFDGPMGFDPETDRLIPYIANATTNVTYDPDTGDVISYFNFDDLETLNETEIGKSPIKKIVTVWYNFTNVIWHDGVQMTVDDVLFSFHVQALMPDWSSTIDCLKDKGGGAGSDFPQTHRLFIENVYESADRKVAALRFYMQTPYAEFMTRSLSAFLMPTHIWASTMAKQKSDECRPWYPAGHPLEWDPDAATAWDMKDAAGNYVVVGNGPFKFDYWQKGERARILTWREHFYHQQPTIDAIVYRIVRTAEQAVLALQNDEVDYIAWSIPPSFVPQLQADENIGLFQSAERGFFYMSYNMRRKSFGYDEGGEDTAKALRRAIAHCVDKQYIVERLLQNYGIAADGPVSSVDEEWYNKSLPQYPFDPEEAKRILTEAGYKPPNWGDTATLGTATNCWKNPDDSKIGSESDGAIFLLTPQADYDPVRAMAGTMICKQLKEIGVYAVVKHMDFGSIVDRIGKYEFDMYILGWRIGSDPTDFLYAFFHSNGGQNYPGYHNSSFDEVIDAARETADLELRKKLVKEATGIIVIDQPYHVLYFRTNIEAYRADHFVNWTVGSAGSIFSWRSILGIKPPSEKYLRVQLTTETAVASNGTAEVVVTVRDQNGYAVAGADVTMNVNNGTLESDDDMGREVSGQTGSNGQFKVTFHAPYVPPPPKFTLNRTLIPYLQEGNATTEILEAFAEQGQILSNTSQMAQVSDTEWMLTDEPWEYEIKDTGTTLEVEETHPYREISIVTRGSKEGYDPISRAVSLKVVSKGQKFTTMRIELAMDVIEEGESTTFAVTVRDGSLPNRPPVPDARLTVEAAGGVEVTPSTATTDQDGKATFTIKAPNVDAEMAFEFKISVDKEGFLSDSKFVPITVTNVATPPPPPPIPFLEVAGIVGLVSLLAIAGRYGYRRRRR
ncbi:MAG: ABC transporter substrate-binding protein [Candidatus Thermoplasmatota archaeon]